MNTPDLFSYPHQAGFKRNGTSRLSAESTDAGTLRALVADALNDYGDMTADEIADRLGLSVLSVRPRCSEMLNLGRIKPTGERRRNRSGKSASVW